MRSTPASVLTFLVCLTSTPVVDACPCAVSAGPAAPLTAPTEHWAFASGLTVLRELGTWDNRSVARGEPAGVRTDRVLLDVSLAWRPTPRLELGLQQGASVTLADAPGETIRERALGDTVARARWDLRMPDARGVLPGLALTMAVRAPTGSVRGSDAVASEVAGLGLGAWELGAGVDLRRGLGTVWEIALAAEGAVRLPDESTGMSRTLGPRVAGAASVMFRPTDDLAAVLSLGEWWEGPTRVGGQTAVDSSFRRTTVSLGLSARIAGLRWTATGAVDPLIDGLGANGVATLRVGLTVAYAR